MHQKDIIRVMQKIRAPMYSSHIYSKDKSDKENMPGFYYEERTWHGKPYIMPLNELKTRPCSWFSAGGGCVTCGYQLIADLSGVYNQKDMLKQTEWVINKYNPEKYPFINFTSAGSLLDEKEIPFKTIEKIFGMLRDAGYKALNFESRPEYLIDRTKLEIVRSYFDEVSVGIGLESKNDFIRNFCLNKGTKLEIYVEALQTAQECDLITDAYVLVGKPFLNMKEDVRDAVETSRFAIENNVDTIIIMVTNLQPYTLTKFMYDKGMYELAKLWLPLEVLRVIVPEHNKVVIKGLIRSSPQPIEFASTCEECFSYVIDSIVFWNLTKDFEHIRNLPDCRCKQDWYMFFNSTEVREQDRLEKDIKNQYHQIEELLDTSS